VVRDIIYWKYTALRKKACIQGVHSCIWITQAIRLILLDQYTEMRKQILSVTPMFILLYCCMFRLLWKAIIRRCKEIQKERLYIYIYIGLQPIRMVFLHIATWESTSEIFHESNRHYQAGSVLLLFSVVPGESHLSHQIKMSHFRRHLKFICVKGALGTLLSDA
jgi:hypothetical protein